MFSSDYGILTKYRGIVINKGEEKRELQTGSGELATVAVRRRWRIRYQECWRSPCDLDKEWPTFGAAAVFGYDTRGGREHTITASRDELCIRYNNSLLAQIRLPVCRDVLTIAEMNICWHGCWEMHTWALGCYRLVCVDESTPVLRFWLVAC